LIFKEEGKLKKPRILVYAFEVVKEFIYLFRDKAKMFGIFE
jgi:hypothetical protein